MNDKMNPKVSVIIPVYNIEKYIDRCIKSVVNQTLRDIEIIVIDDCTPDNSMAIVQSYTKNDFRIRVLKHKENQGVAIARETGYKNAKGEYIVFLDSDDFMPENALEILYEAIVNTKADIVVGDYSLYSEEGVETPRHQNLLTWGDSAYYIKLLSRKKIPNALWGKIFRKEIFSDSLINYPHHAPGQDLYLMLQILANRNRKIFYIPNIVSYYVYNSNSVTKRRYTRKIIKGIVMTSSLCLNIFSDYLGVSAGEYYVIDSILRKRIKRCPKTILKRMCKQYDIDYIFSFKTIRRNFGLFKSIAIWSVIQFMPSMKI